MNTSTMYITRWLGAVLLASLLAAPAQAQDDDDLGATLEQVGELYAEPYVQPLVDVAGADLNSGLFHSANLSGGLLPLVDVYVGLKAFGGFVGDDDETFDLELEDGQEFHVPDVGEVIVDGDQTLEDLPAFFGTDDPGERTIRVRGQPVEGGPTFTRDVDFTPLQGFVQTPVVPLLAPQAEIGSSIIGTNLTLRYIPHALSEAYQDYGSIGLFGVGLRHQISRYIPLLPVSIAGQVMYQNVSIQDADDAEIVSMTNWAANLTASKSFLVATVYGGLQLESAGVTVDYVYDGPGVEESVPVNFELSGANSVRAIAGLSVHPGPIVFNADFSLGAVPVVSAGVGVTL